MRYILYLLLFLVLVPMLRGVLGLVAKLLMSWAVGGNSSAAARRRASAPPTAPGTTTALHKDPVCGVYVSEATAVSCRDGNQTLWFCSTDCLNKYRKGT